MTILSTDIKLRASERMTDATDGGGRRTLNVIADGVAGNVFPKVSRLDAVYGRVNMRKVYPHVDTNTVDTYAGAHFIITDAPDNDRIHVTAFSTGSEFDTRTAARDRIESYVISGPESRMVLYGRQLLGAQALLVYQREEEPLPEIGEVYVVSNETGGVTGNQQFVAIQDMDHEVRTFTDASGDFQRRIITITIGAPLRYEFIGYDTPSRLSGSPAGGKVRGTTVADASRYFGIQPLNEAAVATDLTMRVDSVYTPIVPTTQRETAISLGSVAGANNLIASSASSTPWLTLASGLAGITYTVSCIFPREIVPGTLNVSVDQGNVFSEDDGQGRLVAHGDIVGGTVNYASGAISIYVNHPAYRAGVQVAARAVVGADVSQAAHTRAIEITLGTRGTVHTPVLSPLPAAGTLMVDYRAMGKWYRLRDDGTGELIGGDAAYGTGTVNYVTGGVIITLGALPDVGSSILLSWGSPAHYEVKTNDAGTSAKFAMMLPDLPVKRGSVVVTYYINGVATTAAANLQGIVGGTNSVTGIIKHVTGELSLEFGAKLPDAGSIVSVAYQQLVPNTPGESASLASSFPALTPSVLAGYPFDPGSMVLNVIFTISPRGIAQEKYAHIYDDGVGNLVLKAGTSMAESFGSYSWTDFKVISDTNIGTIDYATGAITLFDLSIPCAGQVWESWGYGWFDRTLSATIKPASTATYNVTVSGVATSDAAKTASTTLDASPIKIDLLRTVGRSIVAGSVMFSLAGKTYIDRNGTMYTDVNAETGVGLAAGTIDYSTGLVSLSQWAPNITAALSVQSCLTKFGLFTTSDAFFRVPGSPLRPASLYVQVTADDGTLITGLADQNGVITGPYMRGQVEQIMGVVDVEFGEMVTAAGNELEGWYNVANVVGAQVWKPKNVQPGTLRYSTVVLSNLPLNADVLGLDPVRLPSDGRVPIYRSADVVVIHNTLSYNAGTPAAGAVLNMGRTDLAACWLEDANKLKLPLTKYTVDLATGLVTMAADLSLTGYVTPITARHRIEEMGLLSDVQINGQITVTAPLQRDYPLGSFVSSALLFGDLYARVTGVFDQGTWTSVWSDSLIGAQATAQYDDVNYPIEVMNSSALSDRWRINFTSTTAFQVISENLGVIATGSTAVDLSPVNPLTGLAYFVLRAAGWGLGWSVGNQLRFRTVGAAPPVWLARTVLPGVTLAGDSFDAQLRGDVD